MARKTRTTDVVFALLALALACFCGFLDSQVLFEYIPNWLAAIAVVILLGPVLAWRFSLPKLAVLSLLLAWLFVVLPQVRWNMLKGFYVDCHSIRPGSSTESAQRVMSKYLGPRLGPAGQFVFTPSQQLDADWCLVETTGSVVARVQT